MYDYNQGINYTFGWYFWYLLKKKKKGKVHTNRRTYYTNLFKNLYRREMGRKVVSSQLKLNKSIVDKRLVGND